MFLVKIKEQSNNAIIGDETGIAELKRTNKK
jgi:hypothetical protein